MPVEAPVTYATAPRSPRSTASAPAELVQLVVVDADVVCELVDDRDRDLVDQLVLVVAHVAQRQAVQRDRVGQHAAVVLPALGGGDTLVQPQQVRVLGVLVL